MILLPAAGIVIDLCCDAQPALSEAKCSGFGISGGLFLTKRPEFG